MDEVDNWEIEQLTQILEDADDQQLAVELLKELNESTRLHGNLLMNKDPNLDHDEWKNKCDEAQQRVLEVVKKIKAIQE